MKINKLTMCDEIKIAESVEVVEEVVAAENEEVIAIQGEEIVAEEAVEEKAE